MGISKPSQGWAKHQKDMAVLYSPQKDMAVLYSPLYGCPVFTSKRYGCPVFTVFTVKPDSVTLAGVEQTGIVGWYFSL
ncbi:hypothetical protein [Shewanella chilikensis]|uniref:hypothetical protein n=1 Tax=Shewanella chilikensis TaxID=558541 RepID=UPI001CFAF4E6|nr:hypothetical protein [Shewanella chilikensis]